MANLSYHAGTAGKVNRKELVKALCHTFRKTYDRYENHNNKEIMQELTKYNLDFNFQDKPIEEVVENRLENEYRGKKAIRKDAVVVREIIASPSRDTFIGMSIEDRQEKMEQFVNDSLPWFKKEFGKKNVLGASAHLDETNPHMHFAIMPMTSDGRMSQKDFFKGPGDLKIQHRTFREHMNKKGWNFDLENKYEDIDDHDSPTFKANASKIEANRKAQTDAVRGFTDDNELRQEALESVVEEFYGMDAAELRRLLLEDEKKEMDEKKTEMETMERMAADKFFNAEEREQQADEKMDTARRMIELSQNENDRNTIKLPSQQELREILEKETDGRFSVSKMKKTQERVLVDLTGEKPKRLSDSGLIRELTTLEPDGKGGAELDLKGNKAVSYVLGYYSSKNPKTSEQAHLDGLEAIADEHKQMTLEYEKERTL